MDYTFVFRWKILNYSLYGKQCGECISSPVFAADIVSGNKWQINLYPKGIADTLRDKHVSICLSMLEADDSDKNIIDYKVDLVGLNGEVFETKMSNFNAFTKETETQGWQEFCSVTDLANKMNNFEEDTLLVNYYFRKSKQYDKFPSGGDAVTVIEGAKCYFKVTIKLPNSTEWVANAKFNFPDESLMNMEMTCPEDDILINFTTDVSFPRTVVAEISLLDVNDEIQDFKKAFYLFTDKDKLWKFPPFITNSKLKNNESILLKEKSFSLMCKFTISNNSKVEEHLEYDFSFPVTLKDDVDTISPLIVDFNNLYLKGMYCDVILRIGSDDFNAHKVILAARSPVLSAMFDHQVLDNQKEIIDITDMDNETLRSFLNFLYTGVVDKLDQNKALKLLVVAEKYGVNSLFQKCAYFILSTTAEGNVCQLLAFAEMGNHESLKAYAIKYVKNNSKKILITEQWREFIKTYYKLGIEVLHQISVDFGKY